MESVQLLGREVPLKCSAFTTIIYEEEFRGRVFLKDYESILNDSVTSGGADSSSKLGVYLRLAWAMARTADVDFMPFEHFADKCSITDIISVATDIFDLVNQSFNTYNGEALVPEKKDVATDQ